MPSCILIRYRFTNEVSLLNRHNRFAKTCPGLFTLIDSCRIYYVFSVGLKVLVWKNVRFCVVTQVWPTSAAFHVSFQFNDWLFGALYFVFHARDVIKINHYWKKYTASIPSFHIKEQNRWEISSLEQNYKVTLSHPIGGWAEISRSARKSFTTVASNATRHNCEKPNLLIRIHQFKVSSRVKKSSFF